MEVLVERYANGERGARAALSIPWGDLVGPNSGLLEVLYRWSQRHEDRALDIGDIVRVPDVGRFIVLASGWAPVDTGWVPPLDPHGRPLPDDQWGLPPATRILQPATDPPDMQLHLPGMLWQRDPLKRPQRPPDKPLAKAARRLRGQA
jgi:hypothetical protein